MKFGPPAIFKNTPPGNIIIQFFVHGTEIREKCLEIYVKIIEICHRLMSKLAAPFLPTDWYQFYLEILKINFS